jgi:exopolysaccharide biosynthesis polyprenyl glycosylphosphotransferase
MLKMIPKKKIVILCGDILLVALAIYIAPYLRLGIFPGPWSILKLSNILAIFVYIFIFYLCDLYNLDWPVDKNDLVFKSMAAALVASVMNASIFYLFHLLPYRSWVIFNTGMLALIFTAMWRWLFMYLFDIIRQPLRILILGAGNTGKKLLALIKTKPDYQLVGFVDDHAEKQGLDINGIPVLGQSKDLVGLVNKYRIDKVIVCVSKGIRPEIYPLLVVIKFKGVAVYEMSTFYEKITGTIPVQNTSNIWMGYADVYGVRKNMISLKLKDFLDKIMALPCFIIAMPVMVLTAIFIKLDSKGPVFYRQARLGMDEKEFLILKFRSMYADAESNGAEWARKNDSRVTRVGKIIRKFRIDELPQLWNVLKGEMSFVGPRPERPEFVHNLKKEIPYYILRNSVKPGITGWAQINYGYGASSNDAQEKLQYDLYYIKNWSFWLDIHIMLSTIRVVILRLGAR